MPSGECGGFKGVEGGKFLVLRRDGSVPDWQWFVLGAADRHAPAALKAYSHEAREPMCSKAQHGYADDVYKLSKSFEAERLEREAAGRKKGDPEAPPHRVDDPLVVALMRGVVTWRQVLFAWEKTYGIDDVANRIIANITAKERKQDEAAMGGEA